MPRRSTRCGRCHLARRPTIRCRCSLPRRLAHCWPICDTNTTSSWSTVLRLLAVTDPVVIAQRMDAILLTIEIGRNRSPEAIRAAAMISIFGPRVLGVVVNCHRIDKHYQFTDFDLVREYSEARHGVAPLGGSLLTRTL